MKLFISYSHKDGKLAESLEYFLQKNGAIVYRDQSRISGGDILIEKIRDDISACDQVLLLWSKNCVRSQYVNFEIQTAQIANKKICPCSIDETKLHFLLDNSVKAIKIDKGEESFKQILNQFRIDSNDNFELLEGENIRQIIDIYKSKIRDVFSLLPILSPEMGQSMGSSYINLDLSPFNSSVDSHRLTSSEVLKSKHNKHIIIGQPGTGKTSLFRNFTFESSSKESGIIPIYSHLENFKTNKDLYSFLIEEASKHNTRNEITKIYPSEKSFTDFETYIFIDGLDELRNEALDVLLSDIDNFTLRYPKSKIFLSSRIGYFSQNQTNFLSWLKYRLEPLKNSDIVEFVKSWHPENSNPLLSMLNESFRLKRLSRIPFLLTLICITYNENKNIEGRRSYIYSKATDYLLNSRQISDQKKSEFKEALSVLAYFRLNTLDFRFSEKVAIGILDNYNRTWSTPNTILLDELANKTGIIQYNKGYYTFVHLTLMEYYAALFLETFKNDVGRTIVTHCMIPYWEETIKLSIGLLNDDKEQERLIRLIWPSNPGLALRVLQETPRLAPSYVQNLIQESAHFERMKLITEMDYSLEFLRDDELNQFIIETVEPILEYENDNSILYFAIQLLNKIDPKDNSGLMYNYFYKKTDDLYLELTSESKYLFNFKEIKDGSFNMGDNESKDTNEKPQHRVSISGFKFQQFQLSNLAYEKIMGLEERRNEYSLSDNQPVININWYDAFICAFRIGCRLPTEAEWEYAARAGSKTNWCFGDDESLLKDYAHYYDNKASKSRIVTEGKMNNFGLVNVHGNVWEWCSDWFAPYSVANKKDPTGPISGELKVRRGGGWLYHARGCRSAFRYGNSPNYKYNDIGVRLAKDL